MARKSDVLISIMLLIAMLGFPVLPLYAQSLTPEQRAQLQAEYDQTMKEINDLQNTINGLQSQGKSLKGDISLLTAQIKQKQTLINQKNILIKQLGDRIAQKSATITSLDNQVAKDKETLAGLLKKTQELDSYNTVEVVLSNQDISEFFSDIDSFGSIQKEMQQLFAQIQDEKTQTEQEKKDLNATQNSQMDARYVIQVQQNQISGDQKEKKQLLAINTNQQQQYQSVLAQKQARAEQIRAALFNLRDTQGIPFGTALQYANVASQKTGVRPALILAILTQESDLGNNIGSCYVTNLDTGDGIGKNTGTPFEKVMKSPRDTSIFENITQALGIPWSSTPVSCPIGGYKYYYGRGYGGAMGPSQFIPSTWELYVDSISKALGESEPNPWNAQDAIMATALLLADNGAALGTYTAEKTAACEYYAGRAACSLSSANSYGNQVIQKAESIQSNIDFLKSV